MCGSCPTVWSLGTHIYVDINSIDPLASIIVGVSKDSSYNRVYRAQISFLLDFGAIVLKIHMINTQISPTNTCKKRKMLKE